MDKKETKKKTNINKPIKDVVLEKTVLQSVDFETGDETIGELKVIDEVVIQDYVAPEPIDLSPVVLNPEVEDLKARINAFTSQMYRQTFDRRHILEQEAKKSFGEDIEVLTGASLLEIAFVVNGLRLPEEGFFFIRP